MPICPNDGNDLLTAEEFEIEIQRCPVCHGEWLDADELTKLEATAGDEGAIAGTVQYATRLSAKKCPVCSASLTAFDYRANDLELDVCTAGHGFWLDKNEDDRVRDLIRERKDDLGRARDAEGDWAQAKRRGFSQGVIGKIRDLLQGK